MEVENDANGLLTDLLFDILKSAPTDTLILPKLETYVDDFAVCFPTDKRTAVKGALKRILKA